MEVESENLHRLDKLKACLGVNNKLLQEEHNPMGDKERILERNLGQFNLTFSLELIISRMCHNQLIILWSLIKTVLHLKSLRIVKREHNQ